MMVARSKQQDHSWAPDWDKGYGEFFFFDIIWNFDKYFCTFKLFECKMIRINVILWWKETAYVRLQACECVYVFLVCFLVSESMHMSITCYCLFPTHPVRFVLQTYKHFLFPTEPISAIFFPFTCSHLQYISASY